MRLYYFNDTNKIQQIFISTFFVPPIQLSPQQGDFFEISISANQIPYIKVWENGTVLLGGTLDTTDRDAA